ncbi:MAG: hypothetical protein K0S27_1258 [Gammaproteobacteria bacterium]|jgi:diguanylate cyclase (GGDEF)-like protein|nr:hypothetical protein [Gammaproteobacteria bacterium]
MKEEVLLSSKLAGIHKTHLAFHEIVTQKIARAKIHSQIVGLLLINIDNFQSINIHLGYHIGEKLLLKMQERLTSCLNSDDFITRIDNGEFVIIMGDIKESEIKKTKNTIKNLMECFNEIYNLDGIDTKISASIGIAYYPHAGADTQTLLQSANISMSHAKSLGGNNYQYHTGTLNKKYKKKSSLEHALKFAVEKQELFLNYQPIFNLKTRKMLGMEALLRWKNPLFGLISPNIFIPLAEENGLITSIGEWSLKNICKQAKEWYTAGYDEFKIYFNISSYQLFQKSFPKFMMRLFKNAHIPPHLLDLELTETAFITKSSYFENILKKISDAGISITIDDFGTGHSSLTRLKHLPITGLKIDKLFISDMRPDSFDAIIVNSLIALGKKLSMNVIAEGIETEAHLQFLIANGCPQGQGYYLCKPLNADQMTSFLKKNNKRCV